MKHRPDNRYLALAAAQTTPVPPPGREWTTEQLREIRIEQARDNEQAWAAQHGLSLTSDFRLAILLSQICCAA